MGSAGVVAAFFTLRKISGQTKASVIAADAAKRSADIANTSLRITQRARVSVEMFKFGTNGNIGNREGKTKFRYSFNIKNTGPTPAHIYERLSSVWFTNGPLPVEPPYTGPPVTGEFVIDGGQAISMPSDPEIVRNDETLYVFGYIKYRDEFGGIHETRYGAEHVRYGDARVIDRANYNTRT